MPIRLFRNRTFYGVLIAILALLLIFLICDQIPNERNISNLFTIRRGDSFIAVADHLKENGYINSRLGFVLDYLKNEHGVIKSGRYMIPVASTNKEICE